MTQMINYHALALFTLDAIVLAYLIVQPLSRRFDDSDRGSGNVIDLPPFGKPSLPRAGWFLAVSTVVVLLIVAAHDPSGAQLYRSLLARTLRWLTGNPVAAAAYAGKVTPLVPAAFAGFLLTAAIVLPGTVGRRLMILAHIPLFIGTSLVTDCALALVLQATHAQLWPAPLVSMFLQYSVGYLVVFRLFFTSHRLPNVTPVPRLRRGDWRDNLVLALCLAASVGLTVTVAASLYRAEATNSVMDLFLLVTTRSLVFTLVSALLLLVRWVGGGLRARVQAAPPGVPLAVPGLPVPDARPPLDVIIPAFNESVCIERMLRSVDRAAGRYGGRVHVIMVDDGSTDDTRALAESVIATYQHATGVVVEGKHGGKARALNMALARATSEFVYRLDADCALDQDAFAYSIADFLADPRVGLVGALQVPKEPYTTWLDRMRGLELFYSFGFLRVGLSEADAVPCIPGTFCAFRRSAAMAVGGFADGMLGEDTEFTCALARIGYRALIDPRVVSYEDVPTSVRQLRLQRFRWGIGGRLVFTRFTPFNRFVGAPGPRFWFQMPRGAGTYMLTPAHVFLWLTSLAFAILAPGPHHNLVKWLGLLLLGLGFALVQRGCVLAYYRRLRLLPWAVLWPVFFLLKHFFLMEAMLAFGMRPVKPPVAIRDRYPTWGALLRPRRPAPELLTGRN